MGNDVARGASVFGAYAVFLGKCILCALAYANIPLICTVTKLINERRGSLVMSDPRRGGDSSGARTQDPNIKSVVLYQLS